MIVKKTKKEEYENAINWKNARGDEWWLLCVFHPRRIWIRVRIAEQQTAGGLVTTCFQVLQWRTLQHLLPLPLPLPLLLPPLLPLLLPPVASPPSFSLRIAAAKTEKKSWWWKGFTVKFCYWV
jgi:hypothetical protein